MKLQIVYTLANEVLDEQNHFFALLVVFLFVHFGVKNIAVYVTVWFRFQRAIKKRLPPFDDNLSGREETRWLLLQEFLPLLKIQQTG